MCVYVSFSISLSLSLFSFQLHCCRHWKKLKYFLGLWLLLADVRTGNENQLFIQLAQKLTHSISPSHSPSAFENCRMKPLSLNKTTTKRIARLRAWCTHIDFSLDPFCCLLSWIKERNKNRFVLDSSIVPQVVFIIVPPGLVKQLTTMHSQMMKAKFKALCQFFRLFFLFLSSFFYQRERRKQESMSSTIIL